MIEKIKIDRPEEHEAVIGERFELHFKLMSLPILSTIQKNAIIKKLNENTKWKVQDIEVIDGVLIATIVIVQNPFPIALAITAVITACAGFFIWASLDKVYKIVESPDTKVFSITAVTGVIALVALLLLVVKKQGGSM